MSDKVAPLTAAQRPAAGSGEPVRDDRRPAPKAANQQAANQQAVNQHGASRPSRGPSEATAPGARVVEIDAPARGPAGPMPRQASAGGAQTSATESAVGSPSRRAAAAARAIAARIEP